MNVILKLQRYYYYVIARIDLSLALLATPLRKLIRASQVNLINIFMCTMECLNIFFQYIHHFKRILIRSHPPASRYNYAHNSTMFINVALFVRTLCRGSVVTGCWPPVISQRKRWTERTQRRTPALFLCVHFWSVIGRTRFFGGPQTLDVGPSTYRTLRTFVRALTQTHTQRKCCP